MEKVLTQTNHKEYIHALFSYERSRFLKEKGIDPAPVVSKWRKRLSMASDDIFQSKLTVSGLSEQRFAEMVTPLTEKNLDEKEIRELTAFLKSEMNLDLVIEGLNLSEGKEKMKEQLDLGLFIHPFLSYISNRLEVMLNKLSGQQQANIAKIKETLMFAIGSQLITQASRSIVLEMHISKLKDELYGSTAEERFQSFIREKALNSSELIKFYEEYAVLTRILILRSEFFLENVKLTFERYMNDFASLSHTFGLENLVLDSIEFGLGDTHQKGKTVGKFVFENGKTIIYKPKGLSISLKYHDLLNWIAERVEFPTLSPYKILDFGTHGWEECVLYSSCLTQQEVKHYYQRFGVLLGLMHSIKGADFHLENIIAGGDTPYIIDHETLFHQSPKLDFPDSVEVDLKYEQADSVVGTGLLPIAMFKNAEGKGIDLSALNGKEQELPFKVLKLENSMTDDMKFSMQSERFRGANNLPTLNGEGIDAGDYLEDILTGFENIFNFFIYHKEELLSAKGPIEAFRHEKIRVVARATQQYFNFLNESSHPDYMRDALYLENLYDRLWFYPYKDKRIIHHEILDLMAGDIPFFNSLVDSRDLYSSTGEKIDDVFTQSGYEIVVDRIQSYDQDELQTQLGWIRTSLVGSKKEEVSPQEEQWNDKPVPNDVNRLFVKEAQSIGDEILNKLRYSNKKDKASLLCLTPTGEGNWSVAPALQGLYDGLGGMSLFFQYLWKETREECYKLAAEATLKSAAAPMVENQGLVSSFTGSASLLYPILHFHKNFGSNEYDWKIEEIKQKLKQNVQKDEAFDFLGGAAGICHLLMNAYEWTSDREYLEIAELYGDHLLANRHAPAPDQAAWASGESGNYLGGFSHGTSGIAQSLFRLSRLTGKQPYQETAEKALRFDQSLFDVGKGAWKDNRSTEDQYVHQWCHGSMGIGLSRIVMSEYTADPSAKREINQAIQNLRKHGYKRSDSLCHGNFGDTELFLQVASHFRESGFLEEAKRRGYNHVLQKEARGYYQVDGPHGFIQPSLFTGLAGIGLQLLRLSNPKEVPPVLLLG
ncbi:type 2 lanthipeptide synthetase LanM family protein [Planococcus sp. N064]|uniref:Type 2 lanthipeptide synthetase LanM family protein n=1 Tax=Planococcus liqunii TaxID=3058394 RepID=A0ABT8MSM8_9BACL|nr:type 2 lanthipeptide synthetase LanM family protein [Planococcus sp. N064]MDN7227916.1 type 2 lanthipeptide synthetase LanM family protein [Planococcus sp. N064]